MEDATSDVRIAHASTADMPAAQAFYDACGYGGAAIQADDFVMLAWQANVIVGVARLCNEHGFLCLRGMQVQASQRGRGTGRRLLDRLSRQIGMDTCYCLPYRQLIDFYATAGFQLSGGSIPEVLERRLAGYRERGLNVVAMMRAGRT